MDKETAIRRIQKCLAMANSNEPNQAAIALRQAQALMTAFNIDHPELLAMGITQEWSKSRATTNPPQYEVALANGIGAMYGCDIIFSKMRVGMAIKGGYNYIGSGTSAQVAAYAFTVLSRQLLNARTEYTALHLKRYKKNKVAAADQFCSGWVYAVIKQTTPSELSIEQTQARAAFMSLHYSQTTTSTPKARELSNTTIADKHADNGWREGKKAQVNAGIGANNHLQIGMA